jgi:hypothetical protein
MFVTSNNTCGYLLVIALVLIASGAAVSLGGLLP